MDDVLATLRIARPHVGLLAAMYTVLGAYLTGSAWLQHPSAVFRAALVIALIVAFGFIINDYHDAVEDRLSKPYRPIPSGRLSRHTAFELAGVFAVLAVLIGASLGLRCGIAAILLIICSAVYSYVLKATLLLGILMVAVLNAWTVLYGCLAVDAFTPAVGMLTVLALLNASTQETLYNLVDRAEDAKSHVRTTAVRLGPEATLTLFSAFGLVCAVATLVPWASHLGSGFYLWAALPCSTLPLLGTVVFVRRRPTQGNLRLAHSVLKLVRLSSVVPVLLLR